MLHTLRHPASSLAGIAVALMMCIPASAAAPSTSAAASGTVAAAPSTSAAASSTVAIASCTVAAAPSATAAPEVVIPGGEPGVVPPPPTDPTTPPTTAASQATVADVATLATAILNGSTDTALDRNGDHRLSIVDIVRLIDRLNHPSKPGGETIIGGGNEEAD